MKYRLKLTKAQAENFVKQSLELGQEKLMQANGMTYASYDLWMQDAREHGVTPESVRRE